MIRFALTALGLPAALNLQAFAFPAMAIETSGRVEAVTVYRGQALVTRLVDIPGPAGLHELVVTDLPEQVVPGSLFAESSDGIEVRSVLYRQRPVTQDIREEVRGLDEQIRQIGDKIAGVAQNMSLLAERKALVEKLESFTAPTAGVELTKGVLNPVTLKDMATYLIEQRRINSEEDLKLKLQKRDLDEQLAVLQRQRDQVAGASAKTAREALVFLNLEMPKGQLRLRYLVEKATWSPSYTARAGDDRATVDLEYFASIQQMSGEDWKDVSMMLSTATPSLIAKAPKLDPLRLELAALEQQSAARVGQEDFYKYQQELQTSQNQVNKDRSAGNVAFPQQRGQTVATVSTESFDESLNDLGCKLQVLEWASQGNLKKSGERPAPATFDSLSVTYQLAGQTSLPSRSDRQLIQIASLPMRGEFYKLAVPLLTESIYEESIITNTTSTVLLAGPVSTYLGGEFVGHGEIPTVTIGEQFTLGFGIDTALRASRELLEKTESLQGGNRIVDLTYRLAIENFGVKPVTVRVLDRKPMSNGPEVQSTLVNAKPDISVDSIYMQTDYKKGILRWELEAPAQKFATNSAAVEYKLRLEYDKQMSISGIALANR